ncbi:MAG: hypothetical protein EPN26_04975 [Rhodospirillales bacterium]|nr:MAG: hypothetical protein EPN26_04975 [Rhodospirillales bacterium]
MNATPTPGVTLPPVDITPETRAAVVDGLKRVLATLQKASKVDAAVSYQNLIDNPTALYDFIQVYRANREAADTIVTSKDNKPVRDDETVLTCGVSLAQIQRLLILTCAKRHFGVATPAPKPPEEKKGGLGSLFRKSDNSDKSETPRSNEERKLTELAKFLAYDWQIPLLQIYRDALTYQHVLELGSELVLLQDAKAIALAGKLDPAHIRKARQVAGPDFVKLLSDNPKAIEGIIYWNADMYRFFRGLLGDRCWAFFGRDHSYFNAVAALDKAKCRLFGESLVYIAPECLIEFERLNLDKTSALIEAFKNNFGDDLERALSEKTFAFDILRRLVESFVHLKKDAEHMKVYADLTCKAILPSVQAWLAKPRS